MKLHFEGKTTKRRKFINIESKTFVKQLQNKLEKYSPWRERKLKKITIKKLYSCFSTTNKFWRKNRSNILDYSKPSL